MMQMGGISKRILEFAILHWSYIPICNVSGCTMCSNGNMFLLDKSLSWQCSKVQVSSCVRDSEFPVHHFNHTIAYLGYITGVPAGGPGPSPTRTRTRDAGCGSKHGSQRVTRTRAIRAPPALLLSSTAHSPSPIMSPLPSQPSQSPCLHPARTLPSLPAIPPSLSALGRSPSCGKRVRCGCPRVLEIRRSPTRTRTRAYPYP